MLFVKEAFEVKNPSILSHIGEVWTKETQRVWEAREKEYKEHNLRKRVDDIVERVIKGEEVLLEGQTLYFLDILAQLRKLFHRANPCWEGDCPVEWESCLGGVKFRLIGD